MSGSAAWAIVLRHGRRAARVERLHGRPEVPTSRRAGAAGLQGSAAGRLEGQPSRATARSRGTWWSVYSDPELDALEEQVSISNQNVLAAEAQFRAARAAVRVAGAGQFPTVSADAVRDAFRNGRGVRRTTALYGLPMDVTYQADVWGSIRRSVAANAAVAQASAAELENARLLYQAELAADYFQIQGLDAQRRLLDATVKSYEQYAAADAGPIRRRRRVDGRRGAGRRRSWRRPVRSSVDLGRPAGAVRARDRRADGQAAVRVVDACDVAAISRLRRRTCPSAFRPRCSNDGPTSPPPSGEVAAANEQIGVAKAAFYPSLTFERQRGLAGRRHRSTCSRCRRRFWSVGAQLAETLFDAGKRRAQVKLTRSHVRRDGGELPADRADGISAGGGQLAALRVLSEEADDRRPCRRRRAAVARHLDDPVSRRAHELSAGHHRADQPAAESAGRGRYSDATHGRERVA